ncbi:MAG: DUF456 domain-containing protein [Microthrixaceae bacterium]
MLAAAAPWWLELTVAVALVVAMVGVVVPVLPGVALAWAAIVVWALAERTVAGWLVLLAASAIAALGFGVKYLVPTRRMRDGGVPTTTMLAGALVGIVGFFVVPVVGAPLGFVLGIYAAEWYRLQDHAEAWPSTRVALGAVGLAMLIEIATVALMATVWIPGAVF